MIRKDTNCENLLETHAFLPGVGVSRNEWEEIKDARKGDKLPEWAKDGQGPFVPPFDRCDREADMRQAYAFFEKKTKREGGK